MIHRNRPDSHVLETISGRGTLFEIIQKDENARRLKALINELKYNQWALSNIMNTVKKNQAAPESRNIDITRLRISAIELLLSTRYFAAEESFFDAGTTCYIHISAINCMVERWNVDSDRVEEGLIKIEERAVENFNSMAEQAQTYYNNAIITV